MRLVIPYKHVENTIELRYSIRSVLKHLPGITGVLLIGDKPEWFAGDHIPMADIHWPDKPDRIWKERSMQLKILACQDEFFIYSNDDSFLNEDFTRDTLPAWYDKYCWEMARDNSIANYRAMYEACPHTWKNFDVHAPILMYSQRFRKTYEQMLDEGPQTPIKTTYCRDFYKGTSIVDIKIRDEYNLPELHELVDGRPFFSTHQRAINIPMEQFFQDKYPNKSVYEKF